MLLERCPHRSLIYSSDMPCVGVDDDRPDDCLWCASPARSALVETQYSVRFMTPPRPLTEEQRISASRVGRPHGGWKQALQRMVGAGRCPFCNYPIVNISVGADGVTWACLDGCNP